MRVFSEDILAWLLSFACLVYILRSIKQVLLPDVGFWRSPFVMFCAGALFSIAATVVAIMCCVLFLTERVQRNANGDDRVEGPPKGINGVRGIRRPWLVRRGRGAKGDLPTPQLVTTHPSAVRDGSYSGPVWIVPATLWTRGQLATQFPPPTQGPAAIARKYHATLIGSHVPHGPALWLVPDRAASRAAGHAGSRQGLLDGQGSGDGTLVNLEGATVDLLRDVLVHRSPWAKRCPLQLSHPTRPLLLGETTLYMFAESGSNKEQWYAALTAAVAPQSVLASTQGLYEEYCRFMANLQVVQPPPLPPAAPPPVMLRAWRFRAHHHQQGADPEQQPQQNPDRTAAAAADQPAVLSPLPAKEQEKDEQQQHHHKHHQRREASKPAGQPEAAPAPRPRGRNPFGFILSRFGRRRAGADAASVSSSSQSQADLKAESVPEAGPSSTPQPSASISSRPPSQQLQQGQESLGQNVSPELGQSAEQGNMAAGVRLSTAPEAAERQLSREHHHEHHHHHHQPQGHDHNQRPKVSEPGQQEEQPSGWTSREQPGAEDADEGAINLTTPPVYRDVSDIFKASTPFSPSARATPPLQHRSVLVAGPAVTELDACGSASQPCMADEPASAGIDATGSETATGLGALGREGVQPMNEDAGTGAASALSTLKRGSLSQEAPAASAMGAAAAVEVPAGEALVTATVEAVTPRLLGGFQAEWDVRPASLQRCGLTQADVALAAQATPVAVSAAEPAAGHGVASGVSDAAKGTSPSVQLVRSSLAANSMRLSPRNDRAEPSFNRWSDVPAMGAPAVKGTSLLRVTADPAHHTATATQMAMPPGPGGGISTAAKPPAAFTASSSPTEPPATPGSRSPGRDPPPQLTLTPRLRTEQQLARRSLPGYSADLSPHDGPTAWPPAGPASQSPAASSAVAPGAAAAGGRWGPALLAQQSGRHGASMPDLFEVARRIAEVEALQEGGSVASASNGLGVHARSSLDECGRSGSPPGRPGQGPTPGALSPKPHKAAHRHTMSLPESSILGEPSVATEAPPGAAAGASPGGSSGGANTGSAGAGSATPHRNLSKQDLRRLQREEQERQKQEQQRAKAAARAAEEARRAEERASRERARAQAQQRRQEEEARARQAKERARTLKQQQQLGSAKSLQDLAAAAAGPSVDPSAAVTPRSASMPVPPEGGAGTAVAPSAAPASPAPSATSTRTAHGAAATGASPSGTASAPASGPDGFVQLPAPSAPPNGALVEALFGLNMVLVRIAFELLRRRGFSTWLHRIIQRALDRVRRPGFLDCLVMRRFDLGFTAPQLRNVRSVAGPYNCGPGSSTWPQLALDIVWVGNATATISTKIDFDKATSERAEQPANPGSTATTAATATQSTAADSSSQTQAATETSTPRPETPSHTPAAGTAVAQTPPPADARPAVAGRTIDEVEARAAAAVSAAPPPVAQSAAAGMAHPGGASGSLPDLRAVSGVGDAPGEDPLVAAAGPPLATDKAPEAQPVSAANSTDGRSGTAAGTAAGDRDAAGSGTGGAAAGVGVGGGGGGGGAGGKGGGFWNFVPFVSLLRKAGQALASNIAGSLSGTPVEVHLRASRFEGTLLLWLAPPPSDRLWLSFAEPPKMEFTVTPVLGNRKLSGGLVVGRLSAWVRSKATEGLARAMVYPACVDVRMGRLLLSIDSPGDALRPFELPPMPAAPPPAFMPDLAPQSVPPGTHPAQPPLQPAGAPMPEPPRGGEPPPPMPSGPPSARALGRPPRPPLSSSNLPAAQWLGESSRAASGLVQPHTPPAPTGGTAFTASGFAAAAASTLGSGSLLENAFQHVIRGTSSIWGSSPGSLSPLEGMSDAEDEEDEGTDEGEEEEYGRGLVGRSTEEGSIHAGQGPYGVEYGNAGVRGAHWSSPYMSGEGLPALRQSAGGLRGSSFSNSQRGRDGAPSIGGEGGMEGTLQHRSAQESLASASWASIPGQEQQQQLQAPAGQAGRRRNGGPLHWMRGAAGLVARGVGGVGGAGMRGLGAVGSALGQAVLGPVVHAGERAVVHQQLHGARTPSRPEWSTSGSTVDLNPTERRSEGGASYSHSGQY